MPDPYSFRESIPNQESLHGLQQMLPPELEPSGFGKPLEQFGYNKSTWQDLIKAPTIAIIRDTLGAQSSPEDYEGAVASGAARSPMSSSAMVQKLMELFSSSMFDPNELNPVQQASEDAQRKAQAELEYRLALEEKMRNGGTNRETNEAAQKAELERGQRY